MIKSSAAAAGAVVSRAVVGSAVVGSAVVGSAVVGSAVVVLVGVPLATLLWSAAGGGWSGIGAALAAPGVRTAAAHTVTIGSAVTVLAVAGGGGLALAVHHGRFGHPRVVLAAMALPLFVPEFVLAYSWSQAYGPSGAIDQLLGVALPGLEGPFGIVLVLACHGVPLAYLVIAGALAVRREPDLDRAARSSGAGPWTVLRTVTVPLLRRPLLSAGALVFAGTVNSFAVPQVLGSPGGYSTMATFVYSGLAVSSDPQAFTEVCVLASAMVLLVLVVLAPADLGAVFRRPPGLRSGPAGAPGDGPSGRPTKAAAAAVRLLSAACVTAYGILAVAVPLLVVVAAAVTRAPGLPPIPRNWTVANVSSALGGDAVPALGRSLALAAASAAAAVLLGGVLVALGRRADGMLGVAVTLGFAVPGTALAVGIMIGYGRWLAGSWAIIALAYLAKFWALSHRAIAAGADRVAGDLVQAARASGAGVLGAARTVVAPLMAGPVITAGSLVFLFALHEVTISSILYGPGTATFAVVVLNLQQLGDPGPTSALALILAVPPVTFALGWMLVRGRR